jgi:hypothetical protein
MKRKRNVTPPPHLAPIPNEEKKRILLLTQTRKLIQNEYATIELERELGNKSKLKEKDE